MKSARVALRVTAGAFCALFFFGTSAVQRAHAQTETVLFNFTSASPHPGGPLLLDSAGNIWGATPGGGPVPGGYGTVYELVNSSGNYTQQILHTFGATGDGVSPSSGVVMDSAGNLYGTTNKGGSAGSGTAFELVKSGGGYTEKVLYSFGASASDGVNPESALVRDLAGNLFGTTGAGGASGFGTVFELVNSSGSYTEKILHDFAGPPSDGQIPLALLMDSSGNLYGATNGGGTTGNGTIFELVNGSGTYTEKLLYSFAGPPNDGTDPTGLIMDSSGNLYGTTRAGIPSVNCCGTVFELVNGSGNYTEKVLYSFTGGADQSSPNGPLILDGTGKFYGTTSGNGAVFELTNSSGSYVEYVLHAFTGPPSDGVGPGSLLMDSAGNLYGITSGGGLNGYDAGFGTAFEIPSATALSVVFTPNALNFGGRLMGTPGTKQSITVTNIGTAGLTFGGSAVTRSGANLADFAITSDGCSGHTLAPATGTCTMSVTYTPSILGAEAASLSFADNGFGNPQTVPLSGIGQDFSLTPIDTTGTVTRPSSVTYGFYINPLGGFTGQVTVSCSNLPPNSACLPGLPVTPDGSNPIQSGVAVETNASAEAIPRWPNQFSPPPAALWIFFAGVAGTSLLARKRTRIRVLAPLALSVLAASCGAAGSGHAGYHGPQTPTGTYTITISASSGGLTHSINVTLIVQ